MIQFEISQCNKDNNEDNRKRISRKCNINIYKNILKKDVRKAQFPLEENDNKSLAKNMKNKIDRQAELISKLMLVSCESTPKKKPSVKTRHIKGKWPEKYNLLVYN